jgi:hypothetical protein
MPLKPIPVKMERAKHPEIATRAMAIERDADSAGVAQEMAEAQAVAKALGIQGINFGQQYCPLATSVRGLQPSDTRSREGQGRAARSRFLTVPDPILTAANPILM